MGFVAIARRTLWAVAAAGVVACWVVAASFAEGAGRWWGHVLGLGLFTLASAGAMLLATHAGRLVALPAALMLLFVGWLTTWMYGFMWVPGAAALLAACLPRPRAAGASAVASAA